MARCAGSCPSTPGAASSAKGCSRRAHRPCSRSFDLADGKLRVAYAPERPARGWFEHLEIFDGKLFAFRPAEALVYSLPRR
ncbi:MAG: hypothetical protein QM765_31195 [Myxococcales bacterium]